MKRGEILFEILHHYLLSNFFIFDAVRALKLRYSIKCGTETETFHEVYSGHVGTFQMSCPTGKTPLIGHNTFTDHIEEIKF